MRALKTRFAWLVIVSAAAHAGLLLGAGSLFRRTEARVWPVDIAIIVEVHAQTGTVAPVAAPEPLPVAEPEPPPPAPPEPVKEPEPPPAEAVEPVARPRLLPRGVQPPDPPALTAVLLPEPIGAEPAMAFGSASPPEVDVVRTVSATLVFTEGPEAGQGRPAADAQPAGKTGATAVAPSLLPGNPTPIYPLAARRASLQGTVVLKVGISSEGRVVEVKVDVSSGHGLLDQEAVRTAKRWRFSPAQERGRRTSSELSIPVRFVLTD